MPKYTNKLNLPQAVVDAVANDPYTRGDADISITQLLKPMRAIVLERKHREEIVEDVSECLWTLYGKIAHQILEHSNKDENEVVERRLYMEVDGIKISGAMDSYNVENGTLIDWKFTNAKKFKGGVPKEWERQQNCYAELLRVNGHKITGLEIVGLLRDYSKSDAQKDPQYPQVPIARMPIPLWPAEKIQAYIKSRVSEYKKALTELPLCSFEERWATQDGWLVKDAQGRFIRSYDNEASAKKHAEAFEFLVEFKAGEKRRCQNFCNVSAFCEQFRSSKLPKTS